MSGEAVETYAKPPHGWTCFFCGETFTTFGAARDHFGADPLVETGCRIKLGGERGLLMALRKAEQELARFRAEDGDRARSMAALQARHADALQDAEEAGYERGLRDALLTKERAATPARTR